MKNFGIDKEKMKKRLGDTKNLQKQYTVMIVDDEPDQLNELYTLFSRDYNVISACDGQEALDYIQENQKKTHSETISVIISDQRMPRLTGLELFDRLIGIIPKTKRIILTGYPEMELVLDGLNKYGIYRYLIKPIKVDELKEAVRDGVREFISYQNLEKHGLTDELTGLKNRQYLDMYIELDIAKVRRDYEELGDNRKLPSSTMPGDLNFLILDIDFFKKIKNNNDSNASGDKILKQIAILLRRDCQEADILVRWSDDKFLIVSRFTPRDRAKDLAERLRKAVAEHKFEIEDGRVIKITCSIGIASYPFLSSQPSLIGWEHAIDIADKVTCAVKNSGSNGWICINATEKTKPDNLYSRICIDIKQLFETGELEYVTSFSKKNKIQW